MWSRTRERLQTSVMRLNVSRLAPMIAGFGLGEESWASMVMNSASASSLVELVDLGRGES